MSVAVDRIETLLGAGLVWDHHACMPLRPGDSDFLPQLESARQAGFTTISLNIGCCGQTPEEHLRVLAWFRHWIGAREDRYQLVLRPGDAAMARASGKLGVLFDIEGATAIGDQISLIQLYRELGVGWMLIAYNRANLAGSGCYDEEDGGLTAFGRDMVKEMNRVGMTVCGSHTGARTVRDAMDASAAPVIFSHSNCASVYAHKRNISDEMIKLCAAQGGVIGVNGIGDFLGPPGADLAEMIVRHIDHAVQLVGPTHVGLALDYVYDKQELIDFLTQNRHLFPDVNPSDPPLAAPGILRDVLSRLIALGYLDQDLGLILGGNWSRIAEQTWRSA
jgi:membrane dipeptidase